MTRHIICMLVKDGNEHDLYESSGALFHKLAFAKQQQSVLLLRFSGVDYRAWSSQPSRVLRSHNYTAGGVDDASGVALYINAHGSGARIAGGEAGDVAAAIIEAIDLENSKIEKLVFLACSMTTPGSFMPDMSKILKALARYDLWKIVLYTSPMTIFSVRNLKFRDKLPAKNPDKKSVQEHFALLKSMEIKFFADLTTATGNEDMVTAFIRDSRVENATSLWAEPTAEARSAINIPPPSVAAASADLKLNHEQNRSEWGRRLVKKGKLFGFSKTVEAMQFTNSPFAHFAPSLAQYPPYIRSPNGALTGPVQCDTERNKVIWERCPYGLD